MKKISIIMPFLNEGDEPIRTIESIYDTTSPDLFHLIAIDDHSEKMTDLSSFPEIQVIRNSRRLGVDGCRQLGADLTQTPYFFIIDAHMRFRGDHWLEKIIESLEQEPTTAWCTLCLGLGYGSMDIEHPAGVYAAATILFQDRDASPDRPAREVLEPKWQARKNGLIYEVPCILGANYGFSKNWFDYIGGLRGLKMWGTSEVFLSLKTWLAGGACKIRTDIEIGHGFRESAPYVTDVAALIYNKIFVSRILFSEELATTVINALPHDSNFEAALRLISEDQQLIKQERIHFQNIQKITLAEFCGRFRIALPG